jgi:phosphatidylglycerophosphate synthase
MEEKSLSFSEAVVKQWEAGIVKFVWWMLAWALTGSRFVASVVIAIAISRSEYSVENYYTLLTYCFLGAMATDLFDGFCAKRAGSHGSFSGKACDPVADYALVGFTLIALHRVEKVPDLYFFAILLGIAFLFIAKTAARHERVEFKSNKVAKINAAMQMTVVYALLAQNGESLFPALTAWLAYWGVSTPIITAWVAYLGVWSLVVTIPWMVWSYKKEFAEWFCKFQGHQH